MPTAAARVTARATPRSPGPTKGERTRARILTAAADHFAAVGFDAGSVPEIARSVGVSHATLYQHFGRKDDLFRATMESDLTGLFDTLTPSLERDDFDAEALVALLPLLIEASRKHPLARRTLADMDAQQADALRDLPALRRFEERLVAVVAGAQRRRRIRDDIGAAEIVAGLIAVTLPILIVALRLDGETEIPRADQALGFLADSIRATGSGGSSRRSTDPTRSTRPRSSVR